MAPGGTQTACIQAARAPVQAASLGPRSGCLPHVPFGGARVGAAVAERVPKTPIRRDQVTETFELPFVSLDEQIRRSTWGLRLAGAPAPLTCR
jgi:hypothetical protein